MQQEYQIKYLRAAMRDLEGIAQLYLGLAGADSAEKFIDEIPVRCIRIWCWQNESSVRSFAVTMYVSTRSLTAKRRSISTAS